MCSCFSFPPQYRGSGRGEREEPGLLGQWGTSATVKHRLPRPGSEKTQALQPSGCSVPSWTGCFVFWFNSLSQETYTSLTQCLSWVLKNLEFTPVSLGSVFSSSFPLNTCCWDTQGKALSLHGVETPACLIKRFKACLDFWQQLNLALFGGLARRASIPCAQRRAEKDTLVRASPLGRFHLPALQKWVLRPEGLEMRGSGKGRPPLCAGGSVSSTRGAPGVAPPELLRLDSRL